MVWQKILILYRVIRGLRGGIRGEGLMGMQVISRLSIKKKEFTIKIEGRK